MNVFRGTSPDLKDFDLQLFRENGTCVRYRRGSYERTMGVGEKASRRCCATEYWRIVMNEVGRVDDVYDLGTFTLFMKVMKIQIAGLQIMKTSH